MRYEGTVYRPPSEAGSLIIQATLACPHNKCEFCSMYKDRSFRVRPHQEVVEDLDLALGAYGPHGVRTIFLADGNSAVLSTRKLVAIGEAARERFPSLERITSANSLNAGSNAAPPGANPIEAHAPPARSCGTRTSPVAVVVLPLQSVTWYVNV